MTATTTRPPPTTPPGAVPAADGAPSGGRGPSAVDRHLPLAELSLASVTAAVVFGFARVFADWDFLWPMLAVAAYAHLITMWLRRKGVGIGLTALTSFGGWLLLATWLWFADTTTFLLPTSRTLEAVSNEFDASWSAFRELTAPVPAQTGFLLASGVALFFAVFLADWAAFRLWSPIEAVVPATTLFTFCALLGSEQQRISSSVLFGGTVLFFLLAHRVARLALQSGWLTTDIDSGARWLIRVGVILGVVAVLAGAVLGPNLPGSSDAGVLDWRGAQGGPSSRVTISPLVDIRQRLTDQTDTEVFTVESDVAAYWRLTALDTFDGQVWRSGGRYAKEDGALPAEVPDGVTVSPVRQTYSISRLAALWLPAAYQPVAIEADRPVRYQPESSTLIVDTDVASSDNLTYEVISDVPAFTVEQLDGPGEVVPADLEPYLALPADMSRDARVLAEQVAFEAGAQTPYQKAMALQSFFRDEGIFADDGYSFVYDLEFTPAGHSGDAIDVFLETGRGYCEQFAGTYAAMARSLGVPARVAVGFTWGDADPDLPGLFRVRGRYAHAWPEVWLGSDVGWVAFEPTPGRGAPGMERYASVNPQQADGQGEVTTTSTSTTVVDEQAAATSSTTAPSADALEDLLAQDRRATTGDDSSSTSTARRVALWIAALAAVALLYVLVTLATGAWRTRLRRAQATSPGARVLLAWDDVADDLALVGVARRPDETNHEFARRAAVAVPAERVGLETLAADADAATFAPVALDPDAAERAETVAAAVRADVHARVTRRRRLGRALDPRHAWARPGHAPRREAVTSAG